MIARALVVLVAYSTTLAASAQDAEPEAKKLTLRPAAAPAQALRYTLLPDLRDQQPGNAVTAYYRAFSPEWWTSITRDKDFYEKTEKWLTMPLKELPASDASWVALFRALDDVDRGARRQHCDWELVDRLRTDGIGTLLPDLQSMRVFGTLMSVRCRLEMAAGEFDKAIFTLQTGFALAKHIGEGPTLMHALVGHAIAAVMLARVEELIQQPGAPNLYWALTALPAGFIDIRRALQGENVSITGYLPDQRELAKPMSIARAREVLDNLVRKTREWSGAGRHADGFQRFATAGWLALAYPHAKERLIAAGRDPAQVEALPTVQVVLLDTFADFNRLHDEEFKAFYLPYPEARRIIARAGDDLKKVMARNTQNYLFTVMTMLLPAVDKVHQVTGRTERRIAFLRTIEAIRMHAAANGGLPPAKLADITVVPVPNDPLTARPFGYEVQGDITVLSAPIEAGSGMRYELTFVK